MKRKASGVVCVCVCFVDRASFVWQGEVVTQPHLLLRGEVPKAATWDSPSHLLTAAGEPSFLLHFIFRPSAHQLPLTPPEISIRKPSFIITNPKARQASSRCYMQKHDSASLTGNFWVFNPSECHYSSWKFTHRELFHCKTGLGVFCAGAAGNKDLFDGIEWLIWMSICAAFHCTDLVRGWNRSPAGTWDSSGWTSGQRKRKCRPGDPSPAVDGSLIIFWII